MATTKAAASADHADHAVSTALDMIDELHKLNAVWKAAFRAAREAYEEHETVLQLDGRRGDAALIVGTYRYIVAALAMPLRWFAYMAGFGGGRELGVQMVERAATYDGDTAPDDRTWARVNANVLLTNPEMLHAGILPSHARWANFLMRLRYVVVDELHALRGLFGSHVAHVLLRLRQIGRAHV